MRRMGLLFALVHVGWLAAAGLWAYGVGRRLLSRLRWDSPYEEAAFAIAAGLGGLGHALFLLGLCGALRRGTVLALVLLGAVYALPPGQLGPAARWLGRRRRPLALATLALLAAAPLWGLALYPPLHFDATLYHLALARRYAATHHIAPVPEVRFPVFPQLNEVLFAAALLLCDDLGAQLLQVLMMAAAALALYAWGRRLFSATAGLLAAALWLGSPLVVWLGTSAYIDMGLTLYCTLASYAMLVALRGGDRGFVVLAGMMGGWAASSKYLGLFFLLAFGLCALYLGWRWCRGSLPIYYAVAGALAGAPWYLYNLWHTGNPVFPFLGQLFGYSYWSPEDLRYQLQEMRSHGGGRGLVELLLLPVRLVVQGDRYHAEAPLSPFYLLLVPALLLGRRRVRDIAAVVLAYTLFWFGTMHIVRYLMPVLPLVSLLMAAALPALERPARRAALGLFLLGPSLAMGLYFLRARGLPPATPAGREAFLGRHRPLYPAFAFLNRKFAAGYRLYGLYSEEMNYYAEGALLGDYFGPGRYARIVPRLGDAAALHAELRALRVDHLLVAAAAALPDREPYRRYFQPVLTTPRLVLYELRGEGR